MPSYRGMLSTPSPALEGSVELVLKKMIQSASNYSLRTYSVLSPGLTTGDTERKGPSLYSRCTHLEGKCMDSVPTELTNPKSKEPQGKRSSAEVIPGWVFKERECV